MHDALTETPVDVELDCRDDIYDLSKGEILDLIDFNILQTFERNRQRSK